MSKRNQNNTLHCSPGRWVRALTDVAAEANLKPSLLLAGKRDRPHSIARWRAWSKLVQAGFSYSSIGKASGFDHTSVRYGHLRINGAPVPVRLTAGR